ncbi:hypothetical protein B879_03012 [Cecembia lonarensis LW9]|uniref:ABC transporter ATPase n=2 Tax=Cecembia TaxID=1187078 RepID=K1L0S5_CECL9|nr:hypothetical protein B879_03012 [Cecembia lonarensis LW9]
MPDDSRIWVYKADRRFNNSELVFVKEKLEQFCEQWNTHGSLMPTSFDIRFDQVIILAVDESRLGASGCSIDSSVRALKGIEQELGINLLDQGKVGFMNEGSKLEVSQALGIKSKVEEGILQADTIVLNPVVQRKSDLQNNWMISAKKSWLNKFFMN